MKHFSDKRVWITGNTGFKGAWLSEMLLSAGAEVYGYSFEPPTTPSLFDQLDHRNRVHQQFADVRDLSSLKQAFATVRPDYVFHLAAQPLVRESYSKPIETFETNVMGTANVLEALRHWDKPLIVIIVTSDKCYRNMETGRPFDESDPLGGHDPYSASKAGAEIVAESYRQSFLRESPVRLATVRAGNVIGGGDWAGDRILPDCARALAQGETVVVRNPKATRPWQHVMDALGGYLQLAQQLSGNASLQGCYNFGPDTEANRSVQDLVETFLRHWPGEWKDDSGAASLHEAALLHLNINKAKSELGWKPVWKFEDSVSKTAEWYHQIHLAHSEPEVIRDLTRSQIVAFSRMAGDQN
ncbi:MAG: CDP-glucose 4,6-dehydratase [Verrucomicrobiota bacterium]